MLILLIANIAFGIHYHKLTKRVSKLEQVVQALPAEDKRVLTIERTSFIEPELLQAVITIESGNDPHAYNESSGAVGLMQLRPIVYRVICGLTKEEAFIPKYNIACGSLYLKHLLIRFDGNVEQALLFYNNGSTVVNKKYATDVLKNIK